MWCGRNVKGPLVNLLGFQLLTGFLPRILNFNLLAMYGLGIFH